MRTLRSGRSRSHGTSGNSGPTGPTPGSAADQAPGADPESVARSVCLRQLTMGPRSRAQLAAVLARKGVEEDVAERVLDRLGDVGLVDDVAFAQAWVRTRTSGKGLGRRALAAELRAKGVDDEIVAAALAGRDVDDELATAQALVERRLAASRGLSEDARVRRLVGMLVRKGYPSGMALAVTRAALAEESAGEESAGEESAGEESAGEESAGD